jgi:hypothetical protein
MAVVLNTQITLEPANQIAHIADFTSLEVGVTYVITATFLQTNTRFTFLGYNDITLTVRPIGVPAPHTEVAATISTEPLAAVPTPPAAYPFALNDRLVHDGLNHAFQLNSGSLPPVGNGGNARQYAEWIDTSTSPATLRMCTVPVASNGYVASEWVKIAAVDIVNNTYKIDQSTITVITPPPSSNDTSLATTAYVQNALTGYLPLSGGTIGALTVNNVVQSFGAGAGFSFTNRQNTAAQSWLWYANNGGAHLWLNGDMLTVDASANVSFGGSLFASGDGYFSNNQVHAGGNGIEYFGNAHQIAYMWDGRVQVYVDRSRLGHIQIADDNNSFSATNIGVSTLSASSTISATGAITGGNLVSNNGPIQSAAGVYASNDSSFGFYYQGGLGKIFNFQGGYYLVWDTSSGNLGYTVPNQTIWIMRASDAFCVSAGYVGGQGFVNTSDRRFKQEDAIVPATKGLDAILQLKPVKFRRLPQASGPSPSVELGFIAQDVKDILPEAVVAIGVELPDGTGGIESSDPTLGINEGAITAALVKAMQELDARLRTLEGVK